MAPKVREIMRRLEADGWYFHSQRGSHRQYKHPTKPGKVTVSGKPNVEVPEDTWRSIRRQAGWPT
jgi:predicted RNA binding protein YcfA (HicA-like mRNA interferase family)